MIDPNQWEKPSQKDEPEAPPRGLGFSVDLLSVLRWLTARMDKRRGKNPGS